MNTRYITAALALCALPACEPPADETAADSMPSVSMTSSALMSFGPIDPIEGGGFVPPPSVCDADACAPSSDPDDLRQFAIDKLACGGLVWGTTATAAYIDPTVGGYDPTVCEQIEEPGRRRDGRYRVDTVERYRLTVDLAAAMGSQFAPTVRIGSGGDGEAFEDCALDACGVEYGEGCGDEARLEATADYANSNIDVPQPPQQRLVLASDEPSQQGFVPASDTLELFIPLNDFYTNGTSGMSQNPVYQSLWSQCQYDEADWVSDGYSEGAPDNGGHPDLIGVADLTLLQSAIATGTDACFYLDVRGERQIPGALGRYFGPAFDVRADVAAATSVSSSVCTDTGLILGTSRVLPAFVVAPKSEACPMDNVRGYHVECGYDDELAKAPVSDREDLCAQLERSYIGAMGADVIEELDERVDPETGEVVEDDDPIGVPRRDYVATQLRQAVGSLLMIAEVPTGGEVSWTVSVDVDLGFVLEMTRVDRGWPQAGVCP